MYWSTALSDEVRRLQTYRKLLKQLPPDNHATLAALFGHLHMYDIKLYVSIYRYKSKYRVINTEYVVVNVNIYKSEYMNISLNVQNLLCAQLGHFD